MRKFVPLAPVLALAGCLSEAAAFNTKLAELTCEQAGECSPEVFELSCQTACTEDEQCPSGRCNRVSGVCRDDDGPLPIDLVGEPCQTADDCGGGPICIELYANQDECVEQVREYWENTYADHCEYEPAIARDCIRDVKKRDCDDELPDICHEVYRDCVF